MRTLNVTSLAVGLALIACTATVSADDYVGTFTDGVERHWVAPEVWTNPMEDWRLADGRVEAIRAGADRNVQLLTRQLGPKKGTLEMSVLIGRADNGKAGGSAGFRIGIQEDLNDYRRALIHGRGTDAGIGPEGALFIANADTARPNRAIATADAVRLRLTAKPQGSGYLVRLAAEDPDSGKELGQVEKRLPAEKLVGNLGLVNNYVFKQDGKPVTAALHWFDDWNVFGSKVVTNDDRVFGPILYSLYTLSRDVLKLTAQMPPLGKTDAQTVDLQIKTGRKWRTIGTETIEPLSRTATFRVEDWDSGRDTPYRLVYSLVGPDGKTADHQWTGTVRREPDGGELVVAGFTGNTDPAFPNALLVSNVAKHDPDVLFFSGDQIYEGVGGYGIHREPVDVAVVNYLRKIYLWGWAFRDITRDRPSLALPDDHDVYQGNIWGNGGNAITMADHPAGGYAQHADFVNAVHRTQTSHHPDLFDPTPIKQGITPFYGDMLYGRVSFAIVADRMFKSGPQGTVAIWPGRPDHVKDVNYDTTTLDKPGLKLLGDRQMAFLDAWAADWTGADLKTVLSQTIFCNLANYHGGGQMFLVADLDSNGWPQSGRNRALDAMRRGFAFHYAGDQHLTSIVHQGIDEWADAGYAFCVPSIAAGYPRSWRPDVEGRPVRNRINGLANTGDYMDGFKNKVRVYAIGNPAEKNRRGVLETLHDKTSGYGLVRFNTETRDITMECWRLMFDADNPQPGDQFPGWPKTVNMLDNYARSAQAHLPTLEVSGMSDPVVQVIDESDGQIVYTLRINGTTFAPKVFRDGSYTVKVGEPSEDRVKTFEGVRPVKDGTLAVEF